MVEDKRNYGIDLLRMFSMFMVVLLHLLGGGGMLGASASNVSANRILWLIEIGCYCAVNCYALVSGWVGYKSKFKFTNIIVLWLQVFFYSFLIHLIFWIVGWQDFSLGSIRSAFFPVMNKEYWYFTAYFIMYMFIPVLNLMLEKFDKKQMSIFLGIGFLLLSILPTFLMTDPFSIMQGYSAWWLAYLYLVGGFLNKYKIFSNGSVFDYLTYYGCLVLFTFLSKVNLEYLTPKIFGDVRYSMILIEYTSPTILFCGIFLVIAFSKMKFNGIFKKLISFFAPISFGVYLIHCNNLMLGKFWVGSFSKFTDYRIVKMIFFVFALAVMVYLICSLIDYIRHLLFKLFRVKEHILKLENKYVKDLFKISD